MGYYASGDTRKTVHSSEDDEGYENQSYTTPLIGLLPQSSIRGAPPISDDTDRPFWAEDELSSSESKLQLNKKQKRRRSLSYRNRLAIHRSRSLLFQSSNSSLDSDSEQISKVCKQQRCNRLTGRYNTRRTRPGYSVAKRKHARNKGTLYNAFVPDTILDWSAFACLWGCYAYKQKSHELASVFSSVEDKSIELILQKSFSTMEIIVASNDNQQLYDSSKNQYTRLEVVQRRSIVRPVFSVVVVGLCILFVSLAAWHFKDTISSTKKVQVFYLNRRPATARTVSKNFLSLGLDTSLLRDMKNLPIENEQFVNLARYLAPAYVRVGGTSSDCLYFNQTPQTASEKVISPLDGQDISNFSITDVDFENLYKFTKKSKLRMIFDLNVLIRDENNSWLDINGKSIISFAKNKNMTLDWQLGNEPNSFHHVFNRSVDASQLANDYDQLRQLLNELGYRESLLVGPEVNHVGDVDQKGEHYATTFLKNDKDSVNYVTWHQYYLNGRTARVVDFLNVSTFEYLPAQIKSMNVAIQLSGKNVPMWLSETSTAYGRGAPDLSDRFVAGFLWLDKLGYSASAGVNVVVRQSLFGGNYAMIGPDLAPNPDWWVSVVYKQFVSDTVLKLTTTNKSNLVRLYAHCTPVKALVSGVPSVTIYGMNIDPSSARIIIGGIYPALHKDAKVFLYALTSDNLQSREIKMNEKTLKLEPNGDLPPFWPIILEPTQAITLPAYSIVFIVIHGVNVPACKVD